MIISMTFLFFVGDFSIYLKQWSNLATVTLPQQPRHICPTTISLDDLHLPYRLNP